MRIGFTVILRLLVLLIFATHLNCGCKLSKEYSAKNVGQEKNIALDAFVEMVVKKYNIPGVATLVVQEGKVLYRNDYGVRSLDNKIQLEEGDNFHAASISKVFVATALMQLVEQGKLRLEDPVKSHLPYFKMRSENHKSITIGQLLSHTSGMPDLNDYEWDKPKYDIGASERLVKNLANTELVFEPGSQFAYSSLGFDVLGDVISKKAEMAFEDYVEKNIFIPLEMKNSTFYYPDVPQARRTVGHVDKENAPTVSPVYPYNRRHAPSSTLNTTTDDLAKWANMILNKGENSKSLILKKQSLEKMFSPVVAVDTDVWMGIGWFITKHKNQQVLRHRGGDTGYRSIIDILPGKNMSVIVLSNYEKTPTTEISEGMIDIVLGDR